MKPNPKPWNHAEIDVAIAAAEKWTGSCSFGWAEDDERNPRPDYAVAKLRNPDKSYDDLWERADNKEGDEFRVICVPTGTNYYEWNRFVHFTKEEMIAALKRYKETL